MKKILEKDVKILMGELDYFLTLIKAQGFHVLNDGEFIIERFLKTGYAPITPTIDLTMVVNGDQPLIKMIQSGDIVTHDSGDFEELDHPIANETRLEVLLITFLDNEDMVEAYLKILMNNEFQILKVFNDEKETKQKQG